MKERCVNNYDHGQILTSVQDKQCLENWPRVEEPFPDIHP